MTGFEPAVDFTVTDAQPKASENESPAVVANALQAGGIHCPCLASLDVDLHIVISAWNAVPSAIRRVIVQLVAGNSA